MGAVKQYMAELDHLRAMARSVLCDARVLRECEYHDGTFYDAETDIEDAYRLANARITSGEIELPRGYTRRDFTDAIKHEHLEHSGLDYCVACDNAMRD